MTDRLDLKNSGVLLEIKRDVYNDKRIHSSRRHNNPDVLYLTKSFKMHNGKLRKSRPIHNYVWRFFSKL